MLKRRLNRIVHVVHLLLLRLVDLLLHGNIKSVITGCICGELWPCKRYLVIVVLMLVLLLSLSNLLLLLLD